MKHKKTNASSENNRVNKSLKVIAKSSLIVFIGVFLSKLFFYMYRLVIARNFGPEIYGLFSLSIMIFIWFFSFFSLGLDKGILRFIPLYRGKNENEKIRYIFNLSRKTLLISSIFSAILLYALSDFISITIFHNENLIIFLRIFALLLPFYTFSEFYLNIIRAHEKISWYSFLANILSNFVKLCFLMLFILLGLRIYSITLSYAISIIVVMFCSYLVYRYYFKYLFKKQKKLKDEKTIRNKFLSYSYPALFLGIVNSLFYFIDSFFIGFFKTATDVGYYNVAIPIAALVGIIPELFMQLFFPLVTKELGKNNKKVVIELSKQVSKWIFVINLPIFILIFLFPGEIIKIIFGNEFLIAQDSLRLLVIGTFSASSIFLITVTSNLLSAKGKSKTILYIFILVSILNAILNILMVPLWGIEGAAFATMISNIFLGIILFVKTKEHLGIIPLRRKMLRILLISFIPAVFLLFMRAILKISVISFLLLSMFFSLFYVLLIFFTGCLDKNDFLILGSIKKFINPEYNQNQ